MKRLLLCLLRMGLLSGCAVTETFETVDDEWAQSVVAPMEELSFSMPKDAAQQTVEDGSGNRLYLCDGYTLAVQTFPSGDTDGTIRNLCGYDRDSLTVLSTRLGEHKRHDWVWCAAGEGGEQLGRAVLVDAGNYHYCLSVMADAAVCGTLQTVWDGIFASVALEG